jgi:hypothetical protein
VEWAWYRINTNIPQKGRVGEVVQEARVVRRDRLSRVAHRNEQEGLFRQKRCHAMCARQRDAVFGSVRRTDKGTTYCVEGGWLRVAVRPMQAPGT